MKKRNLVLPLLLAGLLTLSLVGCGEGDLPDNPPEHSYDTKPSDIVSDRMSEKDWERALSRGMTNYSVRLIDYVWFDDYKETIIIEPAIYRHADDKFSETIYPTTMDDEDPWQGNEPRPQDFYGEYEGTILHLWLRDREEWNKYADWSEEFIYGTLYSADPLSEYKKYYDCFVYDDEIHAYTSTEEGLQKMSAFLNEMINASFKKAEWTGPFVFNVSSIILRFENGYLSSVEIEETLTASGVTVNDRQSWVFFDWGKTVVETPENLPRDDTPAEGPESPEAE